MSDIVAKPGSLKIGGLGRQAQKLQALKDKAAAQTKGSVKPVATGASTGNLKAKNSFAGKKTSFQRKAV